MSREITVFAPLSLFICQDYSSQHPHSHHCFIYNSNCRVLMLTFITVYFT